MKHCKTLFLFGFMVLSLQAWAQPSKGSMLIAGNAGFNSYNFDEFNATVLYLSPSVGYFITDQFAIGADLDLEFYGGDDDGSNLGIGPFVRYYFNNSGPARFFGQAGIGISSFKFDDDEDAISNFGFDIGAGLDYFLNEHVALEGGLFFNSNKDDDDDESATNIGFNIGVAAFIGGGN